MKDSLNGPGRCNELGCIANTDGVCILIGCLLREDSLRHSDREALILLLELESER